MRRIVSLSLILLLAFTTNVYARRGHYSSTVEKRRTEVGVGADLIVYEGKEGQILNKVTVEGKYDWQNGEQQYYAVSTSKLSDIVAGVKKLFKKKAVEE